MEPASAASIAAKKTRQIPGTGITTAKIVFFLAAFLCLFPFISASVALLTGLAIARFIGHPYLHLNHKAIHILLQASVAGLGFGITLSSAMKAGREGFLFTVVSIISTFTIGFFMGKFLGIDRKISYLISAGTAVCGGSAIAAISPVIKAEEKQMSVALGTVFILNAIALFIFPAIGHRLHLSQTQFGLWAAIAIHDTSSVAGAAGKYGAQALEVATTVKLARALWIIPVAFLSTCFFKTRGGTIKIPYFIGLFVLAIIIHTYVPYIQPYTHYITGYAKAGLNLTLFLIGCGLSGNILQSVGYKPLIQGILLWVTISVTALWAVISLTH